MKRENYRGPQGLRMYPQNGLQQPITKCPCKNIQETRAQPHHVTGDILLKPHPYKTEMQHTQAGRQFHPPPHMSQLMRWILEQLWGQSWQEGVEKLERIWETAVKITGWEKNVL